MHAAHDNVSFAPPQPPGMLRAFGLALLAHALLLAALTFSVHWKQTESATVEAEIWSSVAQRAAPKAVDEPPPPPQPVQPPPAPTPPPQPVQKVDPPAPELNDADIAFERARKKREAEKLEQAAQEKLEKAKREKLQLEKDRQEALKAQKAKEKAEKQAEEEAEKKRAEDKRAKDKKAAQDKQAKEAQDAKQDDARKAQADAKALAAQREANLKRIAGMAGATGGATATGTALQSSGPSASYGGKVVAKVRPNIVFPDAFDGNPAADVEVRSSPDGTIVSRRLVKSSGNKAWDDAVLKAIDKTETMPRDTDGRVPSPLIIGFTPKN